MKQFKFLIGNRLSIKVVFTVIAAIISMGSETTFTYANHTETDECVFRGNSLLSVKYYDNLAFKPELPVSGKDQYSGARQDDPKCTDLPTVTTMPATDITATCATLKGIANPNSGSTNYYFDWGTTTAYGFATAPKYAGGGASNVNVFSYISGLVAGTTYHFRLVATNPLGTRMGNDMTFVAGSVTLTTSPVTAITSTSAVSGGNITSNGGFAVTARGVCWSMLSDPTTADAHTSDGAGSGLFVSTIDGLTAGTGYHVRAYATNATGTFYGNDIGFLTTLCGNYTLPYSEGFSAGVLPDCWSLADQLGNGRFWQIGTIDNQSPNPMLNGNYAFLNSNNYGSGDSQNCDLISPVLNLTGYETINLQFNHFLLNTAASSGTLSYSLNQGSDWTVIHTFTTTSLSNPEVFSQDIAAAAGQPLVMFKWNYTGTYGSYWAIDEVQITGSLPMPTLSVTPENQVVLPPSGSTTFAVTTNSNWTAVSDQTWCEVTPSGTGNGTITATYTENNTALQRLAIITITVAGLSPAEVTVTQAAPYLSATPENHNVSYEGGNVVFDITSNTTWSASVNQSWCSLVLSNTGNGTITAFYTENHLPSPRIAEITITVSGLPPILVAVSQDEAPLSLDVTPTNRNVLPDPGSTFFTVSTPLNWSASSDQLWCTVTPAGVGNGTITATYGQNATNLIRVATITVTAPGVPSVVVTVTQSYLDSEFLLSAMNLIQTSPNSLEFDVYLLDTDPGQPFELASLQIGFLLNSDIYAGGVLSATYNNAGSGLNLPQQFTANTSIVTTLNGYPGLTLIRLAGKTPPGTGNGTIISPSGNGTFVTHFTITSSMPFTPNSHANLTFTSSTSTIPLYATRVAAYISGSNTQLLVVSGVNAIIPENPLLNGPPELEVVPGSQTVDTAAGDYGFMVNSNTTWIAHTDQPWVSITPAGFGNGTLIATYDINTSEPRSAIITVSVPGLEDTEVTLSQEGVLLRTLNLNLMIEGLYAGNGNMNQAQDDNGSHFGSGIADEVTLELHNSSVYTIIEHVATDVEVSTSGNATINLPPALNGSYYITVKHRNSIETTSAIPVSFAAQTVVYAFDLPDKAYGNNLQLMIDGHYVIKSGDINQDGSIDTGDLSLVDNDAAGYLIGYIPADVNGDGVVDTADMTIVDNNSNAYVTAETP